MNNGLKGIASGGDSATEVTNAKLANMAAGTFKMRVPGSGTGDPIDGTVAQATAALNPFTSTLQGVVPASGGGTATFLRADATFAAPSILLPVAAGALSAVANIEIPLGTADLYEIDLINFVPSTDNVSLGMRFSQSAVFLSGASDYEWGIHTFDARITDAADTQIILAGGAWGNVATETGTITVRIFRPSAASFRKAANWNGYFHSTSGEPIATHGGGALIANTNAIDGVRILFNSGNIASGYYAARSYSFT